VVNRSDPRSVRTVTRLRRAAEELGATKPLHAISVTELCRAAGVHRTTFYAHYNSVTEVVADALGDRFAELVATRDSPGTDDPTAIVQRAVEQLRAMLLWVREHDADFKVLQVAPVVGHGAIAQRLGEWVKGVHDDMAAGGIQLPGDREVIDTVVTSALAAGIVAWAGSSASAKEFLDSIVAALPGWWQEQRP